ncbi:hypothetical protein V6N12_019362 [Hibiscus sabdariffa]|uniref:Uncharacterized protein n=1 Tax=Hibiscus sabdariffa TaxID=183260 RepID=A0ABR2AE43_9ROSI
MDIVVICQKHWEIQVSNVKLDLISLASEDENTLSISNASDLSQGKYGGIQMLDPVVAMSELHYKLRSNSLANSALDGDAAHVASKNPNLSSSCSTTSSTGTLVLSNLDIAKRFYFTLHPIVESWY